MALYHVLFADRNLTWQGDPVHDWLSLDVTLKFNEPGSGLIVMPGHPWIRDQVFPGCRVVVVKVDPPTYAAGGQVSPGGAPEVLISGPVEDWNYERADDGENGGDGKLTINFADDLAEIVAKLVYPNPALAPEAQASDSWTFTGRAEDALRALVNLNAGPGALAARRMPGLVLGAVTGAGTSVAVSTQRMQPLGDAAREIATVGGGVGFRARQVGQQIRFEVYQPPDKSGEVRFGFGLGNLKYLSFKQSAPTCTAAIVGGQGDGADRFVLERGDTTAQATWGRYEKLVARPGNTAAADLQDDGDRALADGAATTQVSSNVADTDDQRYGVHYDLGTRVSIETWPGQRIAELVRTVHLQAWPTAGEVVSATVGSQAANTDPIWVQRVQEIEERLGRVERIAKPSTP